MNPDMQKQLLARLDALAQKLGVGSQYVWNLYVRQVKVEIIQDVMLLALTALGAWLLAKVILYEIKTDGDFAWPKLASIMGGIAELLLLGCSAYAMFELPQLIFNPNLWVFQQIMSQLSSLKP